jgi:hypothetical protein
MQLFAREKAGIAPKLAMAGGLFAAIALAAVALSATSPGFAARIANDPETQVAVFLIPVTMLFLLMMFEVGRFVWRDRIPAALPPRRRRTHWSEAQRER